jgi:hypothetical protein
VQVLMVVMIVAMICLGSCKILSPVIRNNTMGHPILNKPIENTVDGYPINTTI